MTPQLITVKVQESSLCFFFRETMKLQDALYCVSKGKKARTDMMTVQLNCAMIYVVLIVSFPVKVRHEIRNHFRDF